MESHPTRAWLAVLAVLAVLLGAVARAGEPRPLSQYVHDRWTQQAGLPHNVVETVLVDRAGYLWLGTQEGLVRFDGARFKVFDRATTPGLAGDEVYALLEDAAGDLWIGTSAGLSRRHGERFEVIRTGAAGDESVHALTQSGDELWVGTTTGLRRLRGGRWAVLGVPEGLPDERAAVIAPARGGGIWAGGRQGLARWDGSRFRRDAGLGLPSEAIQAVLEDPEGTVWVGTSRGLARRRAGSARFEVLPAVGDREVRSLALDRDHSVWVGRASGLARVSGERVEALGGGAMIVNGLAQDREGSLWFGTGSDGLHRLRPGSLTSVGPEEGLSSRVVWAVAVDQDGSLLVAGDGGLDRIQGGRVTPVRPELTRREGLTALLVDRAGRLWLGTDSHGVLRLGPEGPRRFGPAEGLQSQPRVIFEGAEGSLWLGARDGLYRLAGGRVELVARTAGPVSVVGEDPAGRIWVGTTTGLARLEGSKLVPVRLPGLDGPADVTALLFDPDGAAWVGTVGSGLWLLRGGAGQAFTRRQGLLENQVFAILDDGLGHLWLSGNHGLTRVARAELEAVARGGAPMVAAVTLGRADGMREIECSGGVQPAGVRAPDGRLWFPTILGVVAVAPAAIRPNPVAQPVFVEAVVVDGQPRSPAGVLHLPPETRHLEIRYAAPALASADRIRFRHRLVGLEEGFVDAGAERVVHYAGLPPGRYQFQVEAANESGRWSDAPATLDFELEPRVWQRAWFKALGALVAATLALIAFLAATRRLRAQKLALAARAEAEAAKVKALSSLLPICSWCKRIKDREGGSWQQLEHYIATQERAQITHVMCPECYAKVEKEEA